MDRGQLYGDGFFETMLVINGEIPLLTYHYHRVLNTLAVLDMELPTVCSTIDAFRDIIGDFIDINATGRLRVNFVRNAGGSYLPLQSTCYLDVQWTPTTDVLNVSNSKKNVGKSTKIITHPNWLNHYKTLTKTDRVLMALEAKSQSLDDLITCMSDGNISELISSNIFFMHGSNELLTPSISNYCLKGVMRQYVIDVCKEIGYKVYETDINIADIEQYSSSFSTNAIQGVVPIKQILDVHYDVKPVNQLALLIHGKLIS